MRIFYGVAYGIYALGRCLEIFVYLDATCAKLYAGTLGKRRIGAYADGEQHDVGYNALARLEEHAYASVVLLEALNGCVEMKRNTLTEQFAVNMRSYAEVDRCHYLRSHLDNRHTGAGMTEILCHLESDESSAYNNGALYAVLRKIVFYAECVFNVAQGEYALGVDAGERRSDGRRAGREQQAVVMLVNNRAVGAAQRYGLGLSVDAYGLGVDAHVDVEAASERLGCLHKKLVLVGNGAADVVGQSAVGI